jgi:hypothetical protein
MTRLQPVSETVTAMQKKKPGPKPKKIAEKSRHTSGQKEHQAVQSTQENRGVGVPSTPLAYLLQGLQAPSPALQLPQTTINDTVLTTLTQAVTALTALTTGARPGPPPATAGEGPRFEPVRSRFPAVDPALLVEILENRFKVENLLKLNASFIYTPERRQENIYLGSIEVPTSRREVKLEEYHNLSWLMEPFEIYCQVLVEFAHDHVKVALAAALGDYRRRLYELNRRCTWESIRHFHFSFHRKRVLTGVSLPSGWREIEPEFLPLLTARQPNSNVTSNPRKRPAPDEGEGSFARRITGGAFYYQTDDVGEVRQTHENVASWAIQKMGESVRGDFSCINSIATDTCSDMRAVWRKIHENP